MTATESGAYPKLSRNYYRSFVSYEIPFRPEDEIGFAETERLRSYYVGHHNADGRVVQFIKIGLVRVDVRTISLPEKHQPGSILYFQAAGHPESGKAEVGECIAYVTTENMQFFFEGQVDESGQNCRITLFHRENVFMDNYNYWPNGNLKERMLLRRNQHDSVWKYDTTGSPLEDIGLVTRGRKSGEPAADAVG